MNQHEMLGRFVARVDLDCVLLAGRYTLLDRSGARVPRRVRGAGRRRAARRRVQQRRARHRRRRRATFDYEPAPAAILDRTARLREACGHHGVPLPAAALDFALAASGRERGRRRRAEPGEIRADVEWAQRPVPPALRAELAAIV